MGRKKKMSRTKSLATKEEKRILHMGKQLKKQEITLLSHDYLDRKIDKETYDSARSIIENHFQRTHRVLHHDKAIRMAQKGN